MEANELYRKPPQVLETCEDLKLFLACKRGRSHVAAGKVCQDYCAAEQVAEEIFVVAVADGHGGDSYLKSDVGSQTACNVIIALTKKYSALDERNFTDTLTAPAFKTELFDAWQAAVLTDYRATNPDATDSDAEVIKK